MAYNGFWADFLFNTCVMAAWCVFLWRVQPEVENELPESQLDAQLAHYGSLAEKYDGSFRHTCENDTYTVTLSLRAG